MAGRAQPVSPWPGRLAAALVAGLILLSLALVLWRATGGRGLGPGDLAAIRFTVLQATLSAALSVALAIPVARALARRRFAGRGLLITVLGAPFILPVIVAVLGLLAVFGQNGWLSHLLGQAGLPAVQVYGLHGVVLAHVFFNLPLATRLILAGWAAIPAERFRLAAQLGMDHRMIARHLERPMLRQAAPGAFALVFAICLTSFAVALTLGGGPRATTIELAIFQAFSFDFDLTRAALLSCLQIALASAAAFLAIRLARSDGFGTGQGRVVERWDARGLRFRIWDDALIGLAALFLLLPIVAIVSDGLAGGGVPPSVWRAAWVSLLLALVTTALVLALAIPMAIAAAGRRSGWLEITGVLALAASPLVIGTGLFILLFPLMAPASMALPVTALVNAIMALPFALRILVPGTREVLGNYGRLALSLSMPQSAVLRHVLLPRLAPEIGFAAGLSAALSMGDLGVIALFAAPDIATLPLQIFRLMGSYQMETAASAALLLLVLSLALFWVFDQGGRRVAGT